MRKQPIVTGEYYHIYNRGVDKRDIFGDKKDLDRFIESIIYFNQIETVTSIENVRKSNQIGAKPLSEPQVAIVVYSINPNHFHFVLKQLVDGGISDFMKKLQGGYTSFFNIKHSRTGSLFQGTFKSHHLGSDNYFDKILGYVNKNYQVHTIPKNKIHFVLASDQEYENNNFKIVSKKEAKNFLEIFNGNKGFKKHCDEMIYMIRKERGKPNLLQDDNLPDRG